MFALAAMNLFSISGGISERKDFSEGSDWGLRAALNFTNVPEKLTNLLSIPT